MENKTVAEKLRETADNMPNLVWCAFPLSVGLNCCDNDGCKKCHEATARMLADMIEAEQAELRAENERLRLDFYEPCARMGFTEHAHGIEVVFDAMSRAAQGHECRVDFKALDLLCDKLECGDANHRATAAQIRKAMNGAKPQLPEGIEWPRFEDGELVKFGDEFLNGVKKCTVEDIDFKPSGVKLYFSAIHSRIFNYGEPVKRPEPEVLDADGVPIKVGDTVWHEADGSELTVVGFRDEKEDGEVMVDVEGKWFCVRQFSLTHRKPDTFKSVVEEMLADFDSHDTIELDGYFARLRVLMGGE